MTDTQEIVWGPAIAVDGKRPGYLRDGECIAFQYAYQRAEGFWHGMHGINFYPNDPDNGKGWDNVRFIRLPADHPYYRQPAPIDWSGELEAVHEDGRVVAVTLREGCNPDADGDYVINGNVDGFNTFNATGLHYAGQTAVHIRNVTPQPTPQADTKPDVTARMEALVRRMALADKQEFLAMGTGCREAYAEADAIVALLPEPVDPDLIEAREIAADMLKVSQGGQFVEETRNGGRDGFVHVCIARAALARGRALALAGEKEA